MGWGGGQRQVAGLCCYLRDQGHAVKLLCRPASDLESWAHREHIDSLPVQMKCAFSPGTVLKMRSLIKRERPDVVHLHASKAHVLGSAAARLAGVPVVIATRRMQDPITSLWPNTSAYGSWTDALVAISQTAMDAMVAARVTPDKIRIIESGVDVDTFADASPDPDLRKSLSIGDDVPIVCAAAILSERKGIGYLIEATSILEKVGKRVCLVIVGDGPTRADLQQLASTLDARVHFLGFRDDMPSVLASIDVFAMPSLSEGLGVAALEAMAAARPVVASAVGGLRESVLHDITGFLVPPRDPKALAEAIGKLLDDPRMAADFGAAGRARVRSNYSLHNMAARNEALYFELLDG